MAGSWDARTVGTVKKLALFDPEKPEDRAGPRDKEHWPNRFKKELKFLIDYIISNKQSDSDWFTVNPPSKDGLKWGGKCWYVHNLIRYEFDWQFEVPATYPAVAPEIEIPELDGKTAKMYRGGKICLTDHFKPLWLKNQPKFGIAHALCLGLAPWLAAEVPYLVDNGTIQSKT